MKHEVWRFGLGLVLAFLGWNLIAGPLLAIYARAVVPAAQWITTGLRPHDIQVVFAATYHTVRWQLYLPSQETWQDAVSFQLLSYNLILYLALLTAIPRASPTQRFVLLLTGLPLFFVFHIIDLLLVVESKLLTRLQPQYYVFWQHFNLWFVFVKFYHSFSVMALKQVLPALMLFLQWPWLKTRTGIPLRCSLDARATTRWISLPP